MKRISFIMAMFALSLGNVFAETHRENVVEIEGIYYILDSEHKTASVTFTDEAIETYMGILNNNYSGDVTIPESVCYNNEIYDVTCISDNAFSDCSNLTSITIPNTITSIGYGSFYGCDSLSAVYIKDIVAWLNISFTNQGSNPLSRAQHLYINGKEITELVIPDSVTTIGNYAFESWSELKSVTLGKSVTHIGKFAFALCYGLETISLNDALISIGDQAFFECNALTNITIPNSVESIGIWAFGYSLGLMSVKLGNSIKSIGMSAFNGCSALTDINIPHSVTTIDRGAFCACFSLSSVTIPESVTSIGESAFKFCEAITDVYALRSDVANYNAHSRAFEYNDVKNTILHVPAGCKDSYSNTLPWSNFETILDDASTTSICNPEENKESFYSDLQGRRLTAEPQRGVFIKGGKKVAK